MTGSAQESNTADDWPKAEALAAQYVKAEKHAVDPISFRRVEAAPFLLAAWWDGGGVYVLVYGGKVHTERGAAALPQFFEHLGEARLRALASNIDMLDSVLQSLEASQPVAPGISGVLRRVDHDQDLFPQLVDEDGVISYVVHCWETYGGPLPPLGAPPPPPGGPPPPPGGSIAFGTPMGLQRWSLQLYPVTPNLDWKREARVERPRPPLKMP